ncbi:MAG TPA: peroxide stress protein YaaA [Rubricoccaceae bacterium]|nr:peroxide stress protein YaaA [Rubricoccaceae bacterium]
MVRFAILIPSAEGKQPGGNPLAPDMFDYRASNTFNFFSELNPERRALIDALQKQIAKGKKLDALFGIQGGALEEALAANRALYDSPLMAAIDRYGPGSMYRAMDFSTLPTGAQRRLLENGVILSGLFGLLRPDDLIPNYRLKMEATVEGIGKVSRYWREPLSARLNALLRGKVVWNLLPATHEDAWVDDGSYDRMYRLKFFRAEKKTLKPVTHEVKELRGALVHFIAKTGAEHVELLEDWEAPGGYEPDFKASELGPQGGTVVMVLRPGWEKRREARRLARAEAPPPSRPSEDDEDEE